MGWNTFAAPSGSWTTSTVQALPWSASPVLSAASGFARVFPQNETTTPEDLPFAWEIRSAGPWYVAPGNNVQVRSSITDLR